MEPSVASIIGTGSFKRRINMAHHAGVAGRHISCRHIVVWTAAFILLAGVAMPAEADKITLGLHLKAGQSFNLLHIIESDLTQTLMGQEMNISQTTGTGYTFDVQEVGDDGTATCKVTYKSVQMIMVIAGNRVEYDSTKPPASVPAAAKTAAALVGQSFSLRVSPTGRVTDVRGVEAIYEKVLKEAEFPNESMRATMEQQLKEQFGADAIRESMEQAIGAHFPDNPVDIGDSWVKQITVARPYPMNLANTCTLKDRKAGIAVIDVSAKISTNPAAKPMQIGPMAMSFELSGERKGQIEVEEATGWTVGARFTQQISGTIKAEGGPEGTMSIPLSGKITIRIESKK